MTKIKMTRARKKILDIFESECRPLNAEIIARKLRNEMDKVTVYRTLILFAKAGLLNQVDLRKDSVHYELASHHHHHIVCTSCGILEEFDICDAEVISKKVLKSSKSFTSMHSHSLEFFGLCNTCAKA